MRSRYDPGMSNVRVLKIRSAGGGALGHVGVDTRSFYSDVPHTSLYCRLI